MQVRIYCGLLGLALIAISVVQCQHYVQCNGIFGQFVASNRSCKHYIYCDDESYEGECDDNLYFDAVQVLCVEKEKANCTDEQNGLLNNNSVTTSMTSVVTTATAATTAAAAATTVQVLNGTANTHNDSFTIAVITTPATIHQPDDHHFVGNEFNGNDNKIIVANACPRQDNLMEMVLVPHTESCADYFVCYQGHPIPMQCASLLQFNAQTGKCDYEHNVKCQSQNAKCASRANELLAHPHNCNYYYQCRNGFLLLRQCPVEQGWDYIKRTCIKRHDAKCLMPNV